ncbi:MAG: hypothetical protein JWR44_346 [Hymenobacter sp.]|jgi:hypothetical protein|nr:hypothetical protein [Hymenobacter sp.]
MSTPPKLLRCCAISSGKIVVDGACVFDEEGDFMTFSNAAFKHLELDYPKFHKMDNLSKLGFLAAEYLIKETGFSISGAAERKGIILANANSSTDTDLRYNMQVQQGLASPALFVYTLPNIVIGEIGIRHGFKGENTLFVSEEYDVPAQVSYITALLDNSVIDTCLGGWIDFLNQDYQAFFYLAGASQQPHLSDYTAEKVETLFTT